MQAAFYLFSQFDDQIHISIIVIRLHHFINKVNILVL